MSNDPFTKHGITAESFIEATVSYLRRLAQFGRIEVAARLSQLNNPSDATIAAKGTFYRAQLWFESAAESGRPDRFQVVATAARALFELLLDIKKLAAEPPLAQAYFDFVIVKRFDMARSLSKFLDANPALCRGAYAPHERIAKDTQKQMERDSLCVRNGWTKKDGQPATRVDHWWGNSTGERAKHFGTVYEERYWYSYSLLSQYVHAGGAGIDGLSSDAFTQLMLIAHRMSHESFTETMEVGCECTGLFASDSALKFQFETLREFSKNTGAHLARGELS